VVAPVAAALFIPDIMTITTLADARELIARRLPADFRERETWQRRAVPERGDACPASARRHRPATIIG